MYALKIKGGTHVRVEIVEFLQNKCIFCSIFVKPLE